MEHLTLVIGLWPFEELGLLLGPTCPSQLARSHVCASSGANATGPLFAIGTSHYDQ